jgi:hypothetical protein
VANSKSLETIYQELDRLAEERADILAVGSIGSSSEGRDIKAVFVTDKGVPNQEKEIVLVVCLRHGDEVGAIAVSRSLLDWLISEEGAETRRGQLVIIVPVANPDGLVRQEFWAPDNRLSETETQTIWALAETYQPDVVIDVHSLGRGDLEAVITGHASHEAEDDFIQGTLAQAMVKGAGAKGYPFLVHTFGVQSLAPWRTLPRAVPPVFHAYNNFFNGLCHQELHSLVFGIEVNDFGLDVDEVGRSGAAAITPLLEIGNSRSPWEHKPGYPNRLLKGNFLTSIRAAGRDASERHKSRAEIWQRREFFTGPIREMPDRNTVIAKTEYSGEKLASDFSICCRIRGNPSIGSVYLNGARTDSYVSHDDCSTYVFADVHNADAGTYELGIKF